MISCYMYVLMLNVVYLPSLSYLKCDWRACGSETLISRLLMPVFQFLMPGRKVWSKVCLLQSLPCVCGHVCVVCLILACTALFCVGTRSEVSPVFLNLIYIYIYVYILIQLDVQQRSQDSAPLTVKERNRPVMSRWIELLKSWVRGCTSSFRRPPKRWPTHHLNSTITLKR